MPPDRMRLASSAIASLLLTAGGVLSSTCTSFVVRCGDLGGVLPLQHPLSAGPGAQRAYSSMDGQQLGLSGSRDLGGGLGSAAVGGAVERPRSASSAAEEDLHRRLSTLGSGFGPGFF